MPEGDTIWRTAAALQQRLSGELVLSAWPAPIARLRGRRLLRSHMRMTGSWPLYAPGQRWRKPRHFARAVLKFQAAEAVLFSAPVLELLRDPATKTGHLGPDILGDT